MGFYSEMSLLSHCNQGPMQNQSPPARSLSRALPRGPRPSGGVGREGVGAGAWFQRRPSGGASLLLAPGWACPTHALQSGRGRRSTHTPCRRMGAPETRAAREHVRCWDAMGADGRGGCRGDASGCGWLSCGSGTGLAVCRDAVFLAAVSAGARSIGHVAPAPPLSVSPPQPPGTASLSAPTPALHKYDRP